MSAYNLKQFADDLAGLVQDNWTMKQSNAALSKVNLEHEHRALRADCLIDDLIDKSSYGLPLTEIVGRLREIKSELKS